MSAVSELETIRHALRRLCLTRWTNNSIIDHITVKLPAPIFDRLGVELQQELTMVEATERGLRADDGKHFTFGGIKFERLDGIYWSVSANEDASGSYMGTGSAYWNKDLEGR